MMATLPLYSTRIPSSAMMRCMCVIKGVDVNRYCSGLGREVYERDDN